MCPPIMRALVASRGELVVYKLLMSNNGIVIVGGGLAAARVAEQLRKAEYAGAITIVSDEEHLPYDRPPLSKEILQDEAKGLADVVLKPAEFYGENDITLRLGHAAESLDTAARTLTLTNGTVLDYDELVIATGLVPKRIPSLPDLAGIHFTGSTPTFQHLWREVGNNIASYRSYPRIVGETGGKDFVFAHPSADIDVLRRRHANFRIIKAEAPHYLLRFEVKDTGIGMTSE